MIKTRRLPILLEALPRTSLLSPVNPPTTARILAAVAEGDAHLCHIGDNVDQDHIRTKPEPKNHARAEPELPGGDGLFERKVLSSRGGLVLPLFVLTGRTCVHVWPEIPQKLGWQDNKEKDKAPQDDIGCAPGKKGDQPVGDRRRHQCADAPAHHDDRRHDAPPLPEQPGDR